MKPNLQSYNPLKRIRERITVWLIIAIVGLLIDEYVKEGYVFDVRDVLKPLTHENIILLIIISLLVYRILLRVLKRT